MKNHEVLEFSNALLRLRKELTGRVFTHAVVLNRKKLEPFVTALEEAKKPSEEMKVCLNEFEELKKKHANKNNFGEPLVKKAMNEEVGQVIEYYDIPNSEDPSTDFYKAKTELYEKNKAIIDEHQKMVIEWAENLLDKESEFKPSMIDLKDIPDAVNHIEMANLIHMINE